MENYSDGLELDNSKRDYLKIEDTDNNTESLGVNTPGESLEDSTQVNRLKRELDYLAGFKDSSNTTKRPRQANNYGSIVSNFGISRKRRRDSEDENTRQDSIRANKY